MVTLRRELGLFDATLLGLGSILGTGVFVSIGIAAGVAGSAIVPAVLLAALVATCNALSSAQLAAIHPVSGGTYEYGYRWLQPWIGFSAGWMFLCAKSASAATAALGFAGYFLRSAELASEWQTPLAIAIVALVTAVVLAGVRLSSWVNLVIVSITVLALLTFIAAGSAYVERAKLAVEFQPLSFLQASALLFVAYTGYGRIATLGEEVVEPRRTIPRAIVTTLLVSAAIYVAVAVVAVGSMGSESLSAAALERAAPLEVAAERFTLPGARFPVAGLIAVGGMTAMLGVLLNLVLGLSRMLLAMGRRGDMPGATSRLSVSIVVVGLAITGLTALGSVKTTWTFSAFTVLIYYSVTNLAALRLKQEERLYSPRWAWGGLASCLLLAFSIDWPVWVTGLGILIAGLAMRYLLRRVRS